MPSALVTKAFSVLPKYAPISVASSPERSTGHSCTVSSMAERFPISAADLAAVSLLSVGGGARLGTGRLDSMVEIALPLNADRFDTGNRNPRISLRIARLF